MALKFDQRGWNRQFKWQPIRIDRWDPFPKDHLPFVDDFSIRNEELGNELPNRRQPVPPRRAGDFPPRRNFMPEQWTPQSRDPIRDLQGNRYPSGPRRRLWPPGANRLPYYGARDRRIRP